ncbi:MAG TPA: pyridoxal-dependent decarboxylase [Acidimicrobiales bacterium]
MTATFPLEPGPDETRAMGAAALSYLEEFLAELPDAPASGLPGALELAERLREPAPEEGTDFARLLATFAEGVATSLDFAGPGYMGYIPGGGLWASAIADFLAAAVNRYVTLWSLAPALAQMEWTTVRWLCDLFDYPDAARGVLTSGGSLANLAGLVTARHARLPENFLAGTLYVTDQTHASVAKAAHVAGFPPGNVRMVATTPDLRMDVDALADLVARDRRAGRQPFCVVASAGTTNTGAIDPLADLAAYCESEGLWLHVDAAYGGPFRLTARGRERLAGIDRADSITLDPHKAMFLPYGTGALLVRDGPRLRDAHHVGAAYLQDVGESERIPSFNEYSPELSRNFRGLRLWLPIMLHGLGAFRDALDEKLDLAGYLYEELRATPRLEVPWEPQLTAVAFRYRPPGAGDGDVVGPDPTADDPERNEELDAANARLLERINASNRILLSSTRIGGRFVIRACILSHRTHRDRVEEAVDIIRSAVAGLAESDG